MIIEVKESKWDSVEEANCNIINYLIYCWHYSCKKSQKNANDIDDFFRFIRMFFDQLGVDIALDTNSPTFLKLTMPDTLYTVLEIKYSEFLCIEVRINIDNNSYRLPILDEFLL